MVQADPAAQAAPEDTGENTPSPVEEPPQAAAPPDPFADATPEQRQAYADMVAKTAQLEHAARSNSNRVSALQRKLNELEKAPPVAEPQPVAPTSQQVEATATPEGLKEFQEEFPEIYNAVNAMYQQQVAGITQTFEQKLAAVTQQVQQVAAPVEQLQATEEDNFRQSQLAAFAQVHPDYAEIQNSNEFWDWVESQADGVKGLAGSVAAADNIALLNLYKSSNPAFVTQAGQPAQQPQQAAAPAPKTPVRQPDVALPRTGAAGRLSDGLPPDDENAAWDYWSRPENYDKL